MTSSAAYDVRQTGHLSFSTCRPLLKPSFQSRPSSEALSSGSGHGDRHISVAPRSTLPDRESLDVLDGPIKPVKRRQSSGISFFFNSTSVARGSACTNSKGEADG